MMKIIAMAALAFMLAASTATVLTVQPQLAVAGCGMKTEAVKTGFYESPHHGKFPKIQILTIEQLFAGKKPQIPFVDQTTFKAAPKEDTSKQGQLL
jgi:hypothetical protein